MYVHGTMCRCACCDARRTARANLHAPINVPCDIYQQFVYSTTICMHTPRLIYIWQWGIVAVRDQVAHFRTPLQQLIQCAHILNVPIL